MEPEKLVEEAKGMTAETVASFYYNRGYQAGKLQAATALKVEVEPDAYEAVVQAAAFARRDCRAEVVQEIRLMADAYDPPSLAMNAPWASKVAQHLREVADEIEGQDGKEESK